MIHYIFVCINSTSHSICMEKWKMFVGFLWIVLFPPNLLFNISGCDRPSTFWVCVKNEQVMCRWLDGWIIRVITRLLLQQMTNPVIITLRMLIGSYIQIYFASKLIKPCRTNTKTVNKYILCLILFPETCPTVLQFCIRCGTATAHIVCLSWLLLQ